MLDYKGGPGPHIIEAKTAIFTIGLPNFPEGPHRTRMTELATGTSSFETVTRGSEVVYALLQDNEVTLSEEERELLLNALLNLSRAALAWRAQGKEDRWGQLQMWAWITHNDEEPTDIPEIDPELIPQEEPE